MTSQFELSDDTPVYVISVAAQISGLHPQTLRTYDRLGLVSPGRAAGRGRRYSLRDILILREVQRLSQEEGINLLAEMQAEVSQLRAELESTRAVAARLSALLRSRTDSAALVPVHGTGRVHPPTGPGRTGTDPAQAVAVAADRTPPAGKPASSG